MEKFSSASRDRAAVLFLELKNEAEILASIQLIFGIPSWIYSLTPTSEFKKNHDSMHLFQKEFDGENGSRECTTVVLKLKIQNKKVLG